MHSLQLERGLGVLYLCRRCIIDEPVHLTGCDRPNARGRQAVLRHVEHGVQSIRLIRSRGDERHAGSMVKHGVRESQPSRWRFRAVGDVRHPSVVLGQERVAWEEGARVAVRADTEQDEVEGGETGRVLGRELADELLLVGVCDILERVLGVHERLGRGWVDELWVDSVDVFLWNGDFGPEVGRAERVVGVLVVEGDDALVRVVDLPVRNGRSRPSDCSDRVR
jgi:hypothetical protein